jgi:hypothetical protein
MPMMTDRPAPVALGFYVYGVTYVPVPVCHLCRWSVPYGPAN